MFNFENAVNVTNKVVQIEDIKLLGGARIKFGLNALQKLGLPEKKVLIIMIGDQLAIAGTTQEEEGRPVKVDSFTNVTLHKLLGGEGSIWSVSEEGQEHPTTGDVYHALTKVEQPVEVDVEEELVKQAESMEASEEAMEAAQEDMMQDQALEQDQYSIAD